jgi:hypothetical protein
VPQVSPPGSGPSPTEADASGTDQRRNGRPGAWRAYVLLATASLLLSAACTKASVAVSPTAPASSGSAAASSGSAAASSGAVASSAAAAASSAAASAAATSAPAVNGVDPLTGLLSPSSGAKTRPALAVKVDNVAGAWPQAGLNQADLVFDLPVEGGLTRLLAIFHSQDVPLIGPIRSARPVDADLLHLLGHAYFAFSGGTRSDLGPLMDHSNATLMWWDVTPSLFVTRRDHAVPHQVFASTSTLYAGGQARAPSKTPPPGLFAYSHSPPAGAAKATSITAQYDAATATWTWNGSAYLRTQNGHPDLLLDHSQVSASDVVVLSVAVHSTAAHDSHGTVVPLPVVIGSGTAWVFRSGVVIKGTWSRPNEAAPMRLLANGLPIALTPGRTWVEVLPNSRQPRVS